MGSPDGQSFGEPNGGSNERSVRNTPTRGLLADVAAPEAAKTTWIYSFVTDPVYGEFSMNVLADIFVRFLLCIATYLMTRLYCGRAKAKEDLEIQTLLRQTVESNKILVRILESMVVGSQGAPGSPETPPASQADNSTAQSSSTAPVPVPENHVQTTGSVPADSIPGSISPPQPTSSTSAITTTESENGSIQESPTSSTKAVPTESKKAVQTTTQPKNGYIIKSSSRGHATSTSSASPQGATPGPDVVAKEQHVLDVTISGHFPSLTETEKGDKFKETVKKLGMVFGYDVCSSRIMQARVPATEENVNALREIAIEGMKLDKGFTLQIGASFVYCCTDEGNPEEPVLLSLKDVEVPTILQAEYSAGMLIVRGRYLEGAEIRAATSEGYMIFASVKQDPIDNKTCTFLARKIISFPIK